MTVAVKPSDVRTLEMKLEVIVIPVSDVERAKQFYGGLGWRLDADFAFDDGFRVIQFTPPGSGASVIFGTNVTAAAPGSAKGLYLVVSDMEAARKQLLSRGVKVSEPFHGGGEVHAGSRRAPSVRERSGQRPGSGTSQLLLPGLVQRSGRQRLGAPGGDRRGFPAAWRVTRPSPRRRNLRPRCAARRLRTASTRSEPASTM